MRRALLLAAVFALAGCGGSKPHSVTVGSYAGFGVTTITGPYSAIECEKDGQAFVREARLFLAHQGQAYPADLYYLDLRIPVADFEARGCEPAALGRPLLRLSEEQRRQLVADLPTAMAQLVENAEHSG